MEVNEDTDSITDRRCCFEFLHLTGTRTEVKDSYYDYDHPRKVFDMITTMKTQSFLCDVRLVVDTVQVPAHKVVLAACSPYFRARFNFEKKNQEHFELKTINPQILQCLVDFIYSSEVEVTEENVQDLLPAADLLALPRVRDVCCDFLLSQLDPTNCLGISDFAGFYRCSDLLFASENYTKQHFLEVIKCEEFLTRSHDQVAKLIGSNDLNAPEEEKVFESVISWVNHDPESRQSHLDQLMALVRFPLIPKDYLLQQAQQQPVFESVISWVNHDPESRQSHLEQLMALVRFPLITKDYLLQQVQRQPIFTDNRNCKGYLSEALEYHSLTVEQRAHFTSSRTEPRIPGKVLLVVGGYASANSSMELYDFSTNIWSDLNSIPVQRNGAIVAVLDGKVYITGGNVVGGDGSGANVYDPSLDQLALCPRMKRKRYDHAVAVHHNRIYAVGGISDASAEFYDPQIQQWHMITSMLTPRSKHGLGVVDDLLYAVGGESLGTQLRSAERYSPETNTWSRIADMFHKRTGVGVGILDGILYSVGGYSYHKRPRKPLKSVDAYNPSTNTWRPVADMAQARHHPGVVAFNGQLYVVGGDKGWDEFTSSVEIYNPRTNSWSMLSTGMNIPRSSPGVCIIDKPPNMYISEKFPHIRRPGSQKPDPYCYSRHAGAALEELQTIQHKSFLCDVLLVVDTVQVLAHKVVLAACSPYFYDMFTRSNDQSQEQFVLQGIDPLALQLLVEFMYSSKLTVTEENVQVLLPAANLLELSSPCDMICTFFKSHISSTNCLRFKALAVLNNCLDVVTVCDHYIKKEFSKVVHSEDFLSLCHHQLSKLIERDDLCVPSEQMVFESMISWVNHDPESRQCRLDQLMALVRFPLIPKDYLLQQVQRQPMFMANAKCREYVTEALHYHELNQQQKAENQTQNTKPRKNVNQVNNEQQNLP